MRRPSVRGRRAARACRAAGGGVPRGRRRRERCASAPIPTTCRSRIARGEGFENQLAELLARDRRRARSNTPGGRSAAASCATRSTPAPATCVMGVPAQLRSALTTTRPYYRSSYVFVSRARRGTSDSRSLDDPRLRQLRIGVQMIGDDFTNSPPAHALSSRGIVAQRRRLLGLRRLRAAEPARRRSSRRSDRGDVDAAIVWGPAAGYFARDSQCRSTLTPGRAARATRRRCPSSFDIVDGVRRGDDGAGATSSTTSSSAGAPTSTRSSTDYGVPRVEDDGHAVPTE